MNYQNYQNLMLLTSSDTKRTLMHLFLFTNSAQREDSGFHMYAEYARQQLTFLALQPWMKLCTPPFRYINHNCVRLRIMIDSDFLTFSISETKP